MKPVRVLHAPVNVAGGPGALSAGLKAIGCESYLLVFQDHRFQHGYDRNLNLRIVNNKLDLMRNMPKQFRALAWALPKFDVFHFHFGHTLVPKKINLPILKLLGKKVVFQFWGSDIRDKSQASFNYLRHADAAILGSHDTFDRSPRSPQWPDFDVVPPAIVLDGWEPHYPAPGDRIKVVHAPSHRGIKGTEAVIAAIDSLQARGVPVDLDLVENVPHEEARKRYEAADIVVDQLRIGWHGIFAVETMALGKPVICHLHEGPRGRAEREFGWDLPLIDATEESLESKIEELIQNKHTLAEIGRASRSYVEAVHSHTAVAQRTLAIYHRTLASN